MEGKDGEDDPRASPLDFPSASRIGAVFHQEQHQHPQQQHHHQQYLWARPLTRNDDAFSARQRFEHTISPPTIPRDTDFFAEGHQHTSMTTPRQEQEAAPPPRQHINVARIGSAAVGSGTGEDRNIMMPRRSPSITSNFSSIVPGNTQEFSTTTSAFTSSFGGARSSQEDLLYHTGRIPAYDGRTIPAAAATVNHQQWCPSAGNLPATGDISPFSNSSTSPRIQQEYHQSRRPISILAPIHTGATSLSPPSSYPLQELSFFAPVPSPQDDQDRSPGTRRGTSQTWSQSPSSLRPSSAHTITTMGSIDESVSSSVDLESTRGRAFVQPTARRTRASSRASSSGRGRSSSVSSPYWQ